MTSPVESQLKESMTIIFSKSSWLKWILKQSDINVNHLYANFVDMTLIGSNFNAISGYDKSLLSYIKKLRFNQLYVDRIDSDNKSDVGEFVIGIEFYYKNDQVDWWKSSATLFMQEDSLKSIFSKISSSEIQKLALFAKIDEPKLIKQLDEVVSNARTVNHENSHFDLPILEWFMDCE